jgi:hypothetical protein
MRECVFEMVKTYLSVCVTTQNEYIQKIRNKYHNCESEIHGYHNSAEEKPSLLAYNVVWVGILVQKLRWLCLPPCSVNYQPTTGQYATYVRPFVLGGALSGANEKISLSSYYVCKLVVLSFGVL